MDLPRMGKLQLLLLTRWLKTRAAWVEWRLGGDVMELHSWLACWHTMDR